MPKARYDAIYQELRTRVMNGTYKTHELLPSENEFTEEFGCSRNTLRRAIAMLTDEAFVQPIHGKGVRVIWNENTHDVIGSLEGVESFNEYAKRNSQTASTEVIEFENVECTEEMSHRLGFDPGDALIRLVRVRSLNGKARQVDFDYFLESAVRGLTPEIASKSIYSYLEGELGMRIPTCRRTISVNLANEDDKKYLDLGEYNCVAVMDNQSYTSDGVLFECTSAHIHPEIFHYWVTARR
jgi:GntR family trehalose operon transcriptional repressor